MPTYLRRLHQFGIVCDPSEVSDRLSTFKMSISKVPLFVQFAFVKCAFNAYGTSYRFGKEVLPCPWCEIPHGDRLDHLLVCGSMLAAMAELAPDLHTAWSRNCHPPFPPQSPAVAFGLDVPSVDVGIELAKWHDLLHSVYSSKHLQPQTVAHWRLYWVARGRVLHRYTKQASPRENHDGFASQFPGPAGLIWR